MKQKITFKQKEENYSDRVDCNIDYGAHFGFDLSDVVHIAKASRKKAT